jgi:hypothetical protein
VFLYTHTKATTAFLKQKKPFKSPPQDSNMVLPPKNKLGSLLSLSPLPNFECFLFPVTP